MSTATLRQLLDGISEQATMARRRSKELRVELFGKTCETPEGEQGYGDSVRGLLQFILSEICTCTKDLYDINDEFKRRKQSS